MLIAKLKEKGQMLLFAGEFAFNKSSNQKGLDLSNYLGMISGTFGSAQEIDDYIKKEREAWD